MTASESRGGTSGNLGGKAPQRGQDAEQNQEGKGKIRVTGVPGAFFH